MADSTHSVTENLSSLVARIKDGKPGLLGLLLALVIAFSLTIPGFASWGTLNSFAVQLPILGLLSLAMVVPLITGGLNLAIIATTNQCALLMAWIMRSMTTADSSSAQVLGVILLALLAGLLLALVIGVVTGTIVAYTGVHPILVTLGTKSLIDGISIYMTRGEALSGFPQSYSIVGNSAIAGIPVTFILLAVVALIVGIILRKTPFGISCAMIGSNIEAARFSAIDTRRVLVGVYTMSSVLCFVAAAVTLAVFNSASADYSQSYLLVTILAAVLGGVDPFGGFGKVSGLMIALAILQIISSGFNQLGISPYLTTAIWGLILILVMAVQTAYPYLTFLFGQHNRRADRP
jgi:simple sugar transport system permease protein